MKQQAEVEPVHNLVKSMENFPGATVTVTVEGCSVTVPSYLSKQVRAMVERGADGKVKRESAFMVGLQLGLATYIKQTGKRREDTLLNGHGQK